MVEWEPDPVAVSADDALGGEGRGDDGRSVVDDAGEWLRGVLAAGAVATRDVEAEARAAGFATAAIRRARTALGVIADKPEWGGQWLLRLPEEGAHTKARKPSLSPVRAFGSQPANAVFGGNSGQGAHEGAQAGESGERARLRAAAPTWADGSPVATEPPPDLPGDDEWGVL